MGDRRIRAATIAAVPLALVWFFIFAFDAESTSAVLITGILLSVAGSLLLPGAVLREGDKNAFCGALFISAAAVLLGTYSAFSQFSEDEPPLIAEPFLTIGSIAFAGGVSFIGTGVLAFISRCEGKERILFWSAFLAAFSALGSSAYIVLTDTSLFLFSPFFSSWFPVFGALFVIFCGFSGKRSS